MKLFLLQNGRPKYLWTNRKPEMLISNWFWVYDLEVLETFPAMALAEASCILAFEWVVFSIWSSVTNSNEIAAFQGLNRCLKIETFDFLILILTSWCLFTFVNVIKFRWVYSSILSTKKLSQCSSSLAEIQTLRSKNRFISKLSAKHFLKNLSLQSVYQIIHVRQSFFKRALAESSLDF